MYPNSFITFGDEMCDVYKPYFHAFLLVFVQINAQNLQIQKVIQKKIKCFIVLNNYLVYLATDRYLHI
jgi:hypothetical protein